MRSSLTRFLILVVSLGLPVTCLAQDESDLEKRKRQRLKDDAADFWIYDDVAQGYTKAKATGKPLLVSFRCVP